MRLPVPPVSRPTCAKQRGLSRQTKSSQITQYDVLSLFPDFKGEGNKQRNKDIKEEETMKVGKEINPEKRKQDT